MSDESAKDPLQASTPQACNAHKRCLEHTGWFRKYFLGTSSSHFRIIIFFQSRFFENFKTQFSYVAIINIKIYHNLHLKNLKFSKMSDENAKDPLQASTPQARNAHKR